MGKQRWIAGAIWLCCAGAHAQDHALIARVEVMLSQGFEPGSLRESIVALGEPAERALWRVYGDAHASRHARLRALSMLSSFPRPMTASGFAELVQAANVPSDDPMSPANSPAVLRRAIDGLRAMVKLVAFDPRSLDFALQHQDAHVRRAATELLATLEGNEVDKALSQQLARDPSRMVRMTAQRAQLTRASRR